MRPIILGACLLLAGELHSQSFSFLKRSGSHEAAYGDVHVVGTNVQELFRVNPALLAGFSGYDLGVYYSLLSADATQNLFQVAAGDTSGLAYGVSAYINR